MTELVWRFEDWPMTIPPLRCGVVRYTWWAVSWNHLPVAPCVNGYARIPLSGHPWSHLEDVEDLDVSVPGGFTFGPRRGFTAPHGYVSPRTLADTCGWVGFDTGHGFDYWSDDALAEAGIVRDPRAYQMPFDPDWSRAWTVEMVEHVAINLAVVIAARAKLPLKQLEGG